MNSLGSLTILLDKIALDKLQRWYQLRVTRYDKNIWKIKILEKLFREHKNKSSFKNPRKRLSESLNNSNEILNIKKITIVLKQVLTSNVQNSFTKISFKYLMH